MKKCFVGCLFLMIHFAIFAQPANYIIPKPFFAEEKAGVFEFSNCTQLQYSSKDIKLKNALSPLIKKLSKAAGILLSQKVACKNKSLFVVAIDSSIVNNEGYELSIEPKKIMLKAKSTTGIFYGVQSIIQLLPEAVEKDSLQKNITWQVPCITIKDMPRFGYRGVMLDVARHYMPISFLQKLIDLLAMQKMNRLHLHLTDSQGWRFESKKYPKLTQIGAYRKGTALTTTYDYNSRPNDTLYGGFYTQQQLRALVKYAQAKFITIVPEIEMPAHSRSALASYPNLACLDSAGKAFPYPQQVQDEYCTKDETFTFLNDILSEVMDVFPSEYIHVAGDEAGKANWKKCKYDQQRMKEEGLKDVDELQSYFIKRIERFVNSKGRRVIGWDEILQGGLAPNATVMSWTGIEGGITAAKQHHNVVMTPGEFCYFDHYQSAAPGEPVAFAGLTTLAKVYSYDPVPAELTAEEAKYIQGTQGNLWTEYIPLPAKAEYMIFPRAVALAEVAWTPVANKNYDDFVSRIIPYFKRLNTYNVNYSRHLFDIKLQTSLDSSGHSAAVISGVTNGYQVRYTMDGTTPTEHSPVYTKPLTILQNGTLTAAVLQDGIVLDQLKKAFNLHKGMGKPITLQTPPSNSYNKGGNNAWVNGSLGNDQRFQDDEWLGWNGIAFDGTIDLGTPTSTHSLQTRFFHKPSSWIWVAKKLTVQTSDDGKIFTTVAEEDVPIPTEEGAMPFNISWPETKARFIRIIATPHGIIEAGNTGAGDQSWLFVDEVVVE